MTYPLEEVSVLIQSGEIMHCMVVAAFAFMGLVSPASGGHVQR